MWPHLEYCVEFWLLSPKPCSRPGKSAEESNQNDLIIYKERVKGLGLLSLERRQVIIHEMEKVDERNFSSPIILESRGIQ